MKVAAAPSPAGFPKGSAAADLEVILYSHADQQDRAGIGIHIPEIFQKRKWRTANRAWDFLSFALAVQAADVSVTRDKSPDGWTRQIELNVSVMEPDFWNGQVGLINSTLQFLTTDIWNVQFQANGLHPIPPRKPVFPTQESVSLLSGGLDSLTGGIDLTFRDKKNPYLVSQVSNGDKKKQIVFAQKLGQPHLQLNHVATSPSTSERSQRARSIVFFAYGVLLATTTFAYQNGKPVLLFVCENGLISINPSLTPMRLGSLSTRTTHPIYLRGLQEILRNAQLNVEIVNPYQFYTKGEMLAKCSDQDMLNKLAVQTTSCGRYARNGFKHCGRCVPCIIRRASFHAWGAKDYTTYVYKDLGKNDKEYAGFDDVRALRMASEVASGAGFDSWLGASLSSPLLGDPTPYKETVRRGMKEVRDFLVSAGVK
jgi:hypothetical protein